MGTCYSSKGKSASLPYSSAPMSASSSQDSALRLPRPTPYTRASVAPAEAPEVTFKRCIPPPTKYRTNHTPSGNAAQSHNKTCVTIATEITERGRKSVTDNADVNNPSLNNNFVEGNPSREIANFKGNVLDCATIDVVDNGAPELKTEGVKVISENSDQLRIQYGTTKIPTKITAHLSGLPKPQVAVVTTRIPPVPQRAATEKLPAATRALQPTGEAGAAEKRTLCQNRVSPDKESISDRSHSGDSGSTDYDSGLGHSLSDPPAGSESGGKAQSSSTTLQEESPPVVKEATNAGKVLDSAVLPTTFPVGAQLATADGAASKMGVYDQPDSYAAYRGILSYRRITPIKKYSEAPQWKRTVEPKNSKGLGSPSRAVIAKGILTKGARAANAVKDSSLEQKREAGAKAALPSGPLTPTKEEKNGGFLSPTSDGFLIDDDISDQPGLIALERSRGRGAPSVKKSIFELHALQSFSGRQNKVDRTLDDLHPLCSDAGSSCSSLGSDDLMLDFETSCRDSVDVSSSPTVKYAGTPLRRLARSSIASHAEKRNSWDSNHSDEGAALRRASDSLASRWPLKTPCSAAAPSEGRPRTISLPLRPPRQVVVQECDDGGVKLDSFSYRSVCQDLNGLKTMLLKLRRILNDAETLNPFELPNTAKNYFYHALASTDLPHGFTNSPTGETPDSNPIDPSEIVQENMDLKRQLILMQQQLEDKDHTIHLLQQQMTKYMNVASTEKNPCKVNAAVQTERPKFLQSISSSSEEGSSQGRLVSSKMKDALEEHLKSSSICHAAFCDKIDDLSKSLCNITQALRQHGSRAQLPSRSQSSWELLSRPDKQL